MITFCHSGKIGDLLYSLNFCLELIQHYGQSKFNYHIQTNFEYKPSAVEIDSIEEANPVLINQSTAQFIKPLLEAQPYIEQVTVGDYIPKGSVDLSSFRKNRTINLIGGDIRDYYYTMTSLFLPRSFQKQIILAEPNKKFQQKILFTLSQRYVNANIDYKQLEQFKDHLVFLGTVKQYQTFKKNYFNLEFAGQFKSLMQIAELIAGARCYIANQTGLYALAEGLKVPRIMISADQIYLDGKKSLGPVNVLPLGGICTNVKQTRKLVDCIKQIVNN